MGRFVRSLRMAAVIAAPSAFAADGDAITTRDGFRYEGRIVDTSNGSYRIELQDGRVVQVALAGAPLRRPGLWRLGS